MAVKFLSALYSFSMRVLFIGNSHTYMNGLPFQFCEMCRSQSLACDVLMVASSGVTLGWHARNPETQMAIQYYPWDYIVLQQKTHPFDGVETLRRDCESLMPLLLNSRARVGLYMTWPEARFPEHADVLVPAFETVAAAFGFVPVPVIHAWQAVRQSAPGLSLYDPDGEHASPQGTWLAASMCMAILTGQAVDPLPHRIQIRKDCLASLTLSEAHAIKSAVNQARFHYNK